MLREALEAPSKDWVNRLNQSQLEVEEFTLIADEWRWQVLDSQASDSKLATLVSGLADSREHAKQLAELCVKSMGDWLPLV